MTARLPWLGALGLAVLAPLTLAQTPPAKTPPAKSPPAKSAEPASAPKAVTAPKAEGELKLDFHVTGLTADNLEKVKSSLTGMTFSTFACDACQVQRAEAGTCPKCKGALKAEKRPTFSYVRPSSADSTIALGLPANHMTRLSEIETALKSDAVAIDAKQCPIPGQAELVLSGAKADGVAGIDKALKDAKLFDDVMATWDAATSEVHVKAHAGAMPPTRARVEGALASLNVHLRDVIWGQAGMKA